MTVARKILIPTLFFSGLVLFALVNIFGLAVRSIVQGQETQQLDQLDQFYENELASLADLASALSTDIASNPEIQKAFGTGDRARLQELTSASYQRLRQQFPIAEYQFISAPATVFLRLQDPANYGDEVSTTNLTAVATNTQKRAVVGLEGTRDGLRMRGVAPVSHAGRLVGSVEIGFNVDKNLMLNLKKAYGNEWQILARPVLGQEVHTPGPITDLALEASTLANPVFAPASDYVAALKGQKQFNQVSANGKTYNLLTVPVYDYSRRVIGVVNIVTDQTQLLAAMNTRMMMIIGSVLLCIFLGGIATSVAIRRALRPITELTAIATAISHGELDKEVPVRTKDEFGILSQAFNQMTQQIRDLVSNLEQRVQERTQEVEHRSQQMQIASDVARRITSAQHMNELLIQAAEQICLNFGFYHTAVFLLDELGEFAYLRAAGGEAASVLAARKLRLRVGEEGIVGFVTATGKRRISENVELDGIYFREALLPDTKAELALPLKVGERVIGAIDIQAKDASAFEEEELTVLETLADQLAIAIENLRLVEQLEAALKETNDVYQQQVREGWQAGATLLKRSAYEYDRLAVRPLDQALSPELKAQLTTGKVVVIKPEGPRTNGRGSTLAVPLVLRNEVIGMIGVEEDDADHEWSQDEINIVQSAATQAAMTLENARLLEETQFQAEREQMIGRIAARVRETLDMDTVLKTTVRELGASLDLAEVEVRLGPLPSQN